MKPKTNLGKPLRLLDLMEMESTLQMSGLLFCEQNDIVYEFIAPYLLESNGVLERKKHKHNRHGKCHAFKFWGAQELVGWRLCSQLVLS